MESLISFLKHSTALDLLIVLLVLLTTAILMLVGIGTAIAARSRTPIYIFLLVGLLPLLLALLGTYLRFRGIERAIATFPEAGSEVVAAGRQEAWIITYLGAAGTIFLSLIGITGLLVKKDRRA